MPACGGKTPRPGTCKCLVLGSHRGMRKKSHVVKLPGDEVPLFLGNVVQVFWTGRCAIRWPGFLRVLGQKPHSRYFHTASLWMDPMALSGFRIGH